MAEHRPQAELVQAREAEDTLDDEIQRMMQASSVTEAAVHGRLEASRQAQQAKLMELLKAKKVLLPPVLLFSGAALICRFLWPALPLILPQLVSLCPRRVTRLLVS